MENVIDYMNVALLSYKTRIFTIRPGYMIRGDRIYARSSLQSAVLNSEKKNAFDLTISKFKRYEQRT